MESGASSSSLSEGSDNIIGQAGVTAALVAMPPRNVFSMGTCSKLCAIFFVAGVVVGYTPKEGAWKWTSKLLGRSKDD